MQKRKVALFGGTFDPIHLGHTTVARVAAEHIGADNVVLIIAKRSPLKETLPVASDKDRLEMITLAIAGNEKFLVSDRELKKSEPSFTLETVKHFEAKYGSNTSIHWLIGADAIDDLPHWYRVVDLIDECNLCVMFRAGCPRPDFARFQGAWGAERVAKLQQNVIPTPLVDISSTEIRRRLASGQDVTAMLAPAVAQYIKEHNLYRSGTRL